MSNLTPEQVRELDEYNELFATPGWKRLIEDAKRQIYQHQADALEVKTWDQVNYLRGRATALAELVNLEAQLELQMANIEENNDAPL